MKIKCRSCGHIESVNLELFIKLIGGVLPIGGFYAWVTYLFAGTGFALPIVVSMIVGGVGLLAFQTEILSFLCKKGYICKKCNAQNWMSIN